MKDVADHEAELTGLCAAGTVGDRRDPDHRPADTVERGGAVSFLVDGVHAHDVGQILDDARHRRSGSGTTAPGRCTAGSASPRPCGRRSRCTTPRPRSTRWSPVSVRTASDSSRWADPCRWNSSTRRSSWTTTARPHHVGLRDPFDTEVHHVNPTCGDEVTLRVRSHRERIRRRSGRVVADISYDSLGLLDLAGVHLGDDRPGHRAHR